MSADESDQQVGGGQQLKVDAGGQSSSSPCVSPGDYAPSPNTSAQALTRAQQVRVQNLLRKLLLELDEHVRLDTLRVLRKTLRELDFQLSWLTQVDYLETLERLVRQASESTGAGPVRKEGQQAEEEEDQLAASSTATEWRLVHDATQLLIESVARLAHEIDAQLIESIVPSVVENLGHRRSEVRRASLLLLNALLHQHTNDNRPGRANLFKLLLGQFIDYGLTNYRNKQAQRGAILSLPLLMSEQLVRSEDLAPLVRCLSELLLVDSNEHLFYSLYLAMQRLHLMIGDNKFRALLARCEPEAAHLYWQAASRQNSLVPGGDSQAAAANLSSSGCNSSSSSKRRSSRVDEKQVAAVESSSSSAQKTQPPVEREQQQHVTFESSGPESEDAEELREQPEEAEREREFQLEGEEEPRPSGSNQSQDEQQQQQQLPADASEFGPNEGGGGGNFSPFDVASSTYDDDDESESEGQQRVGVAAAAATRRAQFSSDVSSTCSSDAHLVNPAHYMTKAALAGHPLDHYEEIHHVDHSNMQSLAINDFGPICNTPTVEIAPGNSPSCLQVNNSNHLMRSHQHHQLEYAQQASELKFGIFPRHLIQVALQSPRASDRYEAAQELMCIVRESPVNHLAILMTYFDSFLEQFLSKLLLNQQASDQFKLELVAIDMIETIIIKTKVSTMHYIRPIVSLLMRALIVDSQQQQQQQQHSNWSVQGQAGSGGNKSYNHHQLTAAPSLFRESTCRVLHKMMAYLPPQHVIDALFEHKHQRAPVVREEAVNRVTAAILEYDRQEFNLTKLCYHILPMLADPQASVRLASLECIATLAHALGPERIGSLLTAAEAVQSGCDYDGLLLGAINARLMRHTLPRCQSNGVVRYALRPHLGLNGGGGGGGGDPGKLPADVRWVLEAPSAHQAHPGGPYYHPHAHAHGQHHGAHSQAQQVHAKLHEAESEPDHRHHRLGVYSPPTQAERRRRSSVGLGLLRKQDEPAAGGGGGGGGGQESQTTGSHRHHHSIARAHRSTSMVAGTESLGQESAARRGRSSSDHSKAEVRTQQNGLSSSSSGGGGRGRGDDKCGSQDKSETHQPSVVARNNSEKEQPLAKRRESRVGSQGAVAVGPAKGREADKAEQPATAPSEHCNCKDRHHKPSAAYRRSNSQDSLSSTDTNKVLFRYYLGKFRQSLAESPGNHQADSIIYTTDVEQAYELTRHRTRFQQTSFDYEADSVGRVPEAPTTVSASDRGRRESTKTASIKTSGQTQQDNMSRQPGPEVDDRCPTSGSESEPQTVLENPKPVEESQEDPSAQAQAQPRQRPILTRSGKSIQRQATIERDQPERPTQEAQEAREAREQQPKTTTTTPAASRRQSVASNASGLTRSQQRHASSGQSSRAGSVGDDPQSGRQSRANSGPDDARARRQRSQSIASRASSNAASEQVVAANREQSESRCDGAAGGDLIANAATVSSSTASEDTSRPSTEGGVEQRSSGRERRRRRSSSQRRRSNAGDPDAPRPPMQRNINDKQQQQQEEDEEARGRRRASRSQPPTAARARPVADNQQQQQQQQGKPSHQPGPGVKLVPVRGVQEGGASRRACSVSPSLASSVNIRHILENVAQSEGPFAEPQLAHKVALSALDSPCWSTKVEGILALIRLIAFHAHQVILSSSSSSNITHDTSGRLHEIVTKVAEETRNLRSTVARSAIFALGDFCARLERVIEPELDLIVHALLLKANENTAFIRDDIRRSLTQLVDHLTPWRLASALLHHGAQHKSVHVRRMASQFVAALVERLGPARCLVGAREISAQLLPAAARFAQDQSPHTRFHGRLILAKLMHHNSFERLLRRTLTSQLYRSTIGIIESVKRRGPGEPPTDLV